MQRDWNRSKINSIGKGCKRKHPTAWIRLGEIYLGLDYSLRYPTAWWIISFLGVTLSYGFMTKTGTNDVLAL